MEVDSLMMWHMWVFYIFVLANLNKYLPNNAYPEAMSWKKQHCLLNIVNIVRNHFASFHIMTYVLLSLTLEQSKAYKDTWRLHNLMPTSTHRHKRNMRKDGWYDTSGIVTWKKIGRFFSISIVSHHLPLAHWHTYYPWFWSHAMQSRNWTKTTYYTLRRHLRLKVPVYVSFIWNWSSFFLCFDR